MRIEQTRVYNLFELIVVVLCGMNARAVTWADIERFGNDRLAWVRTFLRLKGFFRTTHLAACSRCSMLRSWSVAYSIGWTTCAVKSASRLPSMAKGARTIQDMIGRYKIPLLPKRKSTRCVA
jgi:DDE_Tnp_1-associated